MALSLCVLGGSSAFAAGLVDALRDSPPDLGRLRLVLHGRDSARRALIQHYAERQLAARRAVVVATGEMDRALDGADVVLHQIRYGGLELRRHAEELCAHWGVAADETLGPAALLIGLSSMPGLLSACAAIRRWCPTAWVLNLTNPLSAVTAAMAALGVERGVGVCELPLVTQRAVAALLDVAPRRLSWAYTGLNHRGFLHDLRVDTIDVLPDLVRALGERQLGGVTAADIEELNAVPLKYFSLLRRTSAWHPGRAASLIELRERIARELSASCDASPRALAERNQDWYPLAVVPMIRALQGESRSSQVVNIRRADGIVIETRADVGRGDICSTPSPPPAGNVQRWLAIFERHECCFLDALLYPTQKRIVAALLCDPLVPEEKVDAIASQIWKLVLRTGVLDPSSVGMLSRTE